MRAASLFLMFLTLSACAHKPKRICREPWQVTGESLPLCPGWDHRVNAFGGSP